VKSCCEKCSLTTISPGRQPPLKNGVLLDGPPVSLSASGLQASKWCDSDITLSWSTFSDLLRVGDVAQPGNRGFGPRGCNRAEKHTKMRNTLVVARAIDNFARFGKNEILGPAKTQICTDMYGYVRICTVMYGLCTVVYGGASTISTERAFSCTDMYGCVRFVYGCVRPFEYDFD
jgi:hypothetical protein